MIVAPLSRFLFSCTFIRVSIILSFQNVRYAPYVDRFVRVAPLASWVPDGASLLNPSLLLLLYAIHRPPGPPTSSLHNLTCIVRSLFIFGAAPLFVCATLHHSSIIFTLFAFFTGGTFFVFFVHFYRFQGLFFGGWAFYLFVRYPAGRW